MRTYWRIQDAGFPLSRGHRSSTFSEEDSEQIIHSGTSAVYELSDLSRVGPNIRGWGERPEVDIIKFEAREVERGWDNEPVVIPIREISRFRLELPPYSGSDSLRLFGLSSIADLIAAGWKRVHKMEVL